jgi:AhpD family alkylhydroperoxidase
VEERYSSRGAYIRQVAKAAQALCAERLLLDEDRAGFIAAAGKVALPASGRDANPRVPILSREDLAPSDRDIYDDYQQVRNTPPSVIHRAIANAPALLRAYMPISNALRFGTRLDARLRELAIVTVGHVTGSAYEVEAHTRFALQAGVRQEQLEELSNVAASNVYDERERAVIRYAAEVTSRHHVRAETLDALKVHFDTESLVELALQVGFYNMVIRILGAFGIEPEASSS